MSALIPILRPVIGPTLHSLIVARPMSSAAAPPSLREQVLAALAAMTFGMYDISDISTLFQDAAMTIPVTAAGAPVGAVLDISGNGIHLTQATATARPLYQLDGAMPYLAHDGVDDVLLSAASRTLVNPMFLAIALARHDISSPSFFGLGTNSTNHMTLAGTTGNTGRAFLRNAARGQIIVADTGLTVGKHVLSSRSINGSTDIKVDSRAAVSSANTWTGADTTAGARIATGSGGGFPSPQPVDFYGGIALFADPGANRALCEQWLASLNGVVL